MNRRLSFFLLFVVAFLVGCEKYDSLIQDLDDRIEILEGNSIPQIDEQIKEITSKIRTASTKEEKAALGEQIKEINATIESYKTPQTNSFSRFSIVSL